MTAFKLTREQQDRLINFALDQLLGRHVDTPRRRLRADASPLAQAVNGHALNGHRTRAGWTPERRAAFSKKMADVWRAKRKADKPGPKKRGRKPKAKPESSTT